MSIYWLEIKRFFSGNKKFITIGSLILGIFIGGMISFLGQNNTEKEQETEIEDSKEVFENNSRSAFFRFYIEKIDGSSFSNEATINELFNMEELYEEALVNTNINIKEIKEIAEEKEILDFSPVKVKVNGDSNIYTAIFETGDNRDNITLANYYYNYLFDKQFDMLEKHTIYSLVKPELVEDTEEKEEDTKAVQSQKSNTELTKNLVINLIIGFILASTLIIGIILLKELFGKKLNFFFSYDAEKFDEFMIYDKQLGNEKSIQYFADLPHSAKKLVLIESGINIEKELLLFNTANSNFDISNSIDTTSTSKVYDEIILIIKVNKTTRNWYNKQEKLINLHDAKTKIIQFNNDFDAENKR